MQMSVTAVSRQRYYTGIGSRETPLLVALTMTAVASMLRKKYYKLRSGGADGADTAFEVGADNFMEIFLPYRKFNGREANGDQFVDASKLPNAYKARMIAEDIHPAWDMMNDGGKSMHTRNVFQVLGRGLNQPSEFVICWTLDGRVKGGTRTAIVLAERNSVPVYNLAEPKWSGITAEALFKMLT